MEDAVLPQSTYVGSIVEAFVGLRGQSYKLKCLHSFHLSPLSGVLFNVLTDKLFTSPIVAYYNATTLIMF